MNTGSNISEGLLQSRGSIQRGISRIPLRDDMAKKNSQKGKYLIFLTLCKDINKIKVCILLFPCSVQTHTCSMLRLEDKDVN